MIPGVTQYGLDRACREGRVERVWRTRTSVVRVLDLEREFAVVLKTAQDWDRVWLVRESTRALKRVQRENELDEQAGKFFAALYPEMRRVPRVRYRRRKDIGPAAWLSKDELARVRRTR
jgi:type II secretory pathway component PulL